MSLPFYLSCVAILVVSWYAWEARRECWGLPALAVLGTIFVWYFGDVIYNDYERYEMEFGESSLASAWWQVLYFLLFFGASVRPLHRWMNSKLTGNRSHLVDCLQSNRLRHSDVQYGIDTLTYYLLAAWLVLTAIALIRVKGDFIGIFAPYLGQRADPWSRGQIGGGFSALISFASYMQIFFTAAFGVLVSVAYNPRSRGIALTICALALPYYIFDRTRNTMLITILPGLLAFVFFRLRSALPVKLTILGLAFLIINGWFIFVMSNRTGQSIAEAFASRSETNAATRHEGLNMFEELLQVENLMQSGKFVPNRGQNYLAVAANPIPRGLWSSKPTMGLDYAVARGQVIVGQKGEVSATISMGVIGQGVGNFGRFFGPMAAAMLMALWVAILARQDLLGKEPARMILCGCGIIMTFNLGRDITLIALYPFFFGLALLLAWIRYRGGSRGSKLPHRNRRKKMGRARAN